MNWDGKEWGPVCRILSKRLCTVDVGEGLRSVVRKKVISRKRPVPSAPLTHSRSSKERPLPGRWSRDPPVLPTHLFHVFLL